MLRKMLSIVLVALLCQTLVASAQTKPAPAIKFKRQIVECGTNQNVKVTLAAKETLEGQWH